ncbi:MAG: gluconolactonase, partial [Planctomycetaceae bacterium]
MPTTRHLAVAARRNAPNAGAAVRYSLVVASGLAAVLAAFATIAVADDAVPPAGDAVPPAGEVLQYSFEHSRIFPGTFRDYWVYVPRQYDGTTPACVHVNQDGIQ